MSEADSGRPWAGLFLTRFQIHDGALLTAGSVRRNLSGEARKFRTMPKNGVGRADKAAGQAGRSGGQDLAGVPADSVQPTVSW